MIITTEEDIKLTRYTMKFALVLRFHRKLFQQRNFWVKTTRADCARRNFSCEITIMSVSSSQFFVRFTFWSISQIKLQDFLRSFRRIINAQSLDIRRQISRKLMYITQYFVTTKSRHSRTFN